jgi:hypothetical protein
MPSNLSLGHSRKLTDAWGQVFRIFISGNFLQTTGILKGT